MSKLREQSSLRMSQLREQSSLRMRPTCPRCRRAAPTCYCDRIRPFDLGDTGPLFVLLVHPREARNRVGTARIVRLCVSSSVLIEGTGEQLDVDPVLARILDEPANQCWVLYPGADALWLEGDAHAVSRKMQGPRRQVILVIDGTWSMAKKMIRTSSRLRGLPQLAFRPDARSNYRIREQPGEVCLSTLEAVYSVIERLQRAGLATSAEPRAHENLLEVFDWMVELQISCERKRALALE